MSLPYLEVPDALLAAALAQFSPTFRRAQIRALLRYRKAEGGFSGREGPADPYYTDFAVRVLVPAAAPPNILIGAARYVTGLPPAEDLAHAFSRLNVARLLARAGHAVAPEATDPGLALRLNALPSGGYRRTPGAGASAYATFIATLCLALTGRPLPSADELRAALLPLGARSGGFREQEVPGRAQANATAAVLGAHALSPFLEPERAEAAKGFLRTMQTESGGFLSHQGAAEEDLLSTFSALYALGVTGELGHPRLVAAVRFVRALAHPGGGFRSCLSDPEGDAEFAYYGLSSLALARAALLTAAGD